MTNFETALTKNGPAKTFKNRVDSKVGIAIYRVTADLEWVICAFLELTLLLSYVLKVTVAISIM